MAVLKPITEWATNPWGQNIPIHIAWFLMWVTAVAALLFLIVHASYLRHFAKAEVFAGNVSPTMRREFYVEHYDPPRWRLEIPRSGAARTDGEAQNIAPDTR